MGFARMATPADYYKFEIPLRKKFIKIMKENRFGFMEKYTELNEQLWNTD